MSERALRILAHLAPARCAAAAPLAALPTSGEATTDFGKPGNTVALHALHTLEPSNKQGPYSGGTSGVLPSERKKASFDVERLTNVLDGGKKRTARRRFILSPGKDADASDKYFLDRHGALKEHLRHFWNVHDEFLGTFRPTRDDVIWMSENSMYSGTMMNHYGLFLTTIMNQGSDEQMGEWLPRALMGQIIGSYAQTELGHGSNVRGLQTTATYDKSTQQFVLNTPTLQSIKWWPGTLGKVGTHALVYAQLLIDGKEYGVHCFFVQIRDENHRPLPGIELGDLGPKLGDHCNDTGFMRLDNIRIPRQHMLARHQQISEDGVYSKTNKREKNEKLHYATMMFTRGGMVRIAGGKLAIAVTIATRYSAVRQQGFVDTSREVSYRSGERQIIDWQMQRYRLLRQMALCYALKFVGTWMTERFSALTGGEEDGATSIIKDTTDLPEIAATSAGLKGLCTFLVSQGIEDLRKCCGGNGYLLNSGIAALSVDYLWQTTAEGDWIILMLQTARFLVKMLENARRGDELSGLCEYLAPLKHGGTASAPLPAVSLVGFMHLDHLVALFKHRALMRVVECGDALHTHLKAGKGHDDAWNACSIQLVNAVMNHCHAFILNHFARSVGEVQDAPARAVLTRLCQLYACTNIVEEQWAGLIDGAQLQFARTAIEQLLDALRPDAVALADALDIPDNVLNSTLGRADGNVYEALFGAALKSELNQVDPFEGYHEVLRGRLDLEFLRNKNAASTL